MKDSICAGAFLILYLALYGAAGYAGITLMEWVWIKVFG